MEGAKAPSTSKSRPQISSPINFDHVLHVGFNGETGEFEGLPKEWEAHLQNSNISKKERQENPETIIAVSIIRGLDSRIHFSTLAKIGFLIDTD